MDGFNTDRAELLRMLPWLLDARRRELDTAQEAYRDAVRDLVLAGYSWADVGRMLGVTRQSARERFGPHVQWWRDHMGNRMPWDDWQPDDLGEHASNMAALLEAGPYEDLR